MVRCCGTCRYADLVTDDDVSAMLGERKCRRDGAVIEAAIETVCNGWLIRSGEE